MKRQLLTLIMIFVGLPAFSQSDLRPGYIVLHSGDSLKGAIEYNESKSAFRKCNFKQSNQGETVSYSPEQIVGYGFLNDKSLISKLILMNQDSTMVFLEELVRGLVSLYKFEDRYWVQRTGGKLNELTDIEKQVYVQGKGMMNRRVHEYRGMINLLMYDCSELKEKIEKLDLTQKELTIIVEDYNRCKGSVSQTPKANKLWMKVAIYFQAGPNLSTLKVEKNAQLNYLTGKYETSLSPMAGAAFNFLFPRFNEKLSVHTEILYLSSSYNKPITDQNHMTAKVKQLKVPLGVRYTLRKRLTPFIGTGISYSFHVKNEAEYVSGSFEIDQTSKLKNHQLGFWAGTGICTPLNSKLKGSMEIRYELTNGIYVTKSKVSNLQLIFGLKIK